MSLRARLALAAQDAVIFTVRWLVVVALTIGFGHYVVADYLHTREGANMGRAAVDYLNKVIAEQQKAAAAQSGQAPAPAPTPAPSK